MINATVAKSNRCNGDLSCFLKFPYDTEVLDIVRNFPTRYWDKDNKSWEIPLNKLEMFIDKCSALKIPREIEVFTSVDIFHLGEEKSVTIANFDYKTKPFEHQIDGFNYGMTHSKWLLGDEQGLGKTKQVIDIAIAKKKECGYKHCLIVCCVNGLKWNWVNEVATHSDEQSYILGQRRKRNGKLTVDGNAEKLADLKNLPDAYFIITNVESLRDESIAKILGTMCKSGTIGMVAIDEIHKCKNPSTQQGKGILRLQPDYRIAMSGTPLMNKPMDLFIILKWLGYEKHSFTAFKSHYCVLGGYTGYDVIGYKYLDELQETLNSVMLRRLKSDVLDLPDKIFVNEYVDMTPKQTQVYHELLMQIKENIDQIKMAKSPLAELIRLRQATGYTGILSSTIQESAKLDRMEEIVDEATANGNKVVIFSNWTQITNEVFHRLTKNHTPVIITGETSDDERMKVVKQFQEDSADVIIGTIGAMGTGLTLTAGTVEIFLDEPWNMALKDQAVDRCHRIGQKSNVTVYTLMCKNTIDERINELVAKKGAMADALIDGKMTKSDLVDFLLD